MEDLRWMEEYVADVPYRKGFYNFMKFFLFRWKKGLTYKELYLILRKLHNKGDQAKANENALVEILSIYYYNNNCYPKK